MKELKRLRMKFVVTNMAMVSLVIGLAFLAAGYVTRAWVDRNNEQALGRINAENVQEFFTSGRDLRMPYFILTTNQDADILRVEGQYGFEPEDEFLRFLAAESLSSADDQGFLERYHLQYSRKPVESGYLITYVDTSLGEAYAAGTWKTLGIICGGVWVALLIASCCLSKWAVAPVGESIRREKQFVADASHELKTPLTVIMANAQLLEEAGDSALGGDSRRWLTNICQEAEEMKKLVEQMLTLARNEAAGAEKIRDICCLSDLAEEQVLSFEAVFYQSDKILESQIEEGIFLTGEEQKLSSLIKILLDNAERYSPKGGTTTVRLTRISPKKARLIVANPGPEITEDQKKALFDRFYRPDASRSGGNGYGLGLAIAKSVVDLHHGAIKVESERGENRFIVELRVLPSKAAQ